MAAVFRTFSILIFSLVFVPQIASAQAVREPVSSDKENSAVEFAVKQEVKAAHLGKEQNICLRFGYGLTVDQGDIFRKLNKTRRTYRKATWCNQGPSGSLISIIAPLATQGVDTYQIVVELSDLRSIKQGEHFGTLVRRGTYNIRVDDKLQPELIAYTKSCCNPGHGLP
jgi:hypothetical protein